MPTVHLVCGYLGAGKSTFSRSLAAQRGALRLSIDELYLRLFARGPTHDLDVAAQARLLDLLGELWPQVVASGVDVVLDFGFWSRAQRQEVRRRAALLGADAQLYWLRCPDALALQRCLQRNGSPGAFLISEQGFAQMYPRFEAPSDEERPQLVDTGGPAPS